MLPRDRGEERHAPSEPQHATREKAKDTTARLPRGAIVSNAKTPIGYAPLCPTPWSARSPHVTPLPYLPVVRERAAHGHPIMLCSNPFSYPPLEGHAAHNEGGHEHARVHGPRGGEDGRQGAVA